jgi:hypothetical protein
MKGDQYSSLGENMKKQTILSCSAAFIAMASTSFANLVSIDARSVHVPLGFDGNDRSEIAVLVELPSSCHLRPYGEVKVADNEILIDMKAHKVTPSRGINCIQAIIPTLVSVPVGVLSQGQYQVTVNPERQADKKAPLIVSQAGSESIDDHPYANITNVKKSEDGLSVILEGYHPSSCMEIARVELVPNAQGDTIAVLPIVNQTEPVCDTMIKPFTYTLENIKKPHQDLVLHIRKLDGNAVNFKI